MISLVAGGLWSLPHPVATRLPRRHSEGVSPLYAMVMFTIATTALVFLRCNAAQVRNQRPTSVASHAA